MFFLTLINHSKELTFCDYNPEKRTSFVPCKTHAFPVFSTIVIRNASYLQSKKKNSVPVDCDINSIVRFL